MKKLLIILLVLIFSIQANAEMVRGYVKKDGTYVSPYYRRPKGTAKYSGYSYSSITKNSTPPKATTPATKKDTPKNKKWLDFYKSAAMITGDTSNLKKVEYICKYDETNAFWESIESELGFCKDRGCFLEWITKSYKWKEFNKKIDNIYNFIISAPEK